MFFKIFIFLTSIFLSFSSFAGDIILDAENQVEYHQKEQKLVAKGNAVASKDNMLIKAETLIGYYSPEGKSKISRIEAHGNVFMKSDETEASGNKMIYDINDDTATLTGTPAKIKTPETSISAQGSITYYQSQQKAIAKDNVIAVDGKGNKVYGDLMTAWFKKDKNGKMVLDTVDIEHNAKIISSEGIVTAKKGNYNAITGIIKLFDDIEITQNGNVLRGSKAETNLNTGISKIISGNKRVSGIIKEKKKNKE